MKSPMRVLAAAALAAGILGAGEAANADFPMRPPGTPLRYVDGVLESWGAGNRSGGITIAEANGSPRAFAMSDAIVVDGKPVRCAYPPKAGHKPDRTLCDSWPANLTLGKTRVRVAYWRDAHATDPTARDVVASLKTLP